jgi:ankyrin repeat protein
MSVNVTNSNDVTPLHVSAKFGNLEATKDLVARGAAINYPNIDGNTPLMVAVCKGKLEIFRYLTERGADINIRVCVEAKYHVGILNIRQCVCTLRRLNIL